MNYYFAPMEGITGYIYRRAYHRFFKGVDKYFTPFLAPDKNRMLKTRELEDILPEHNQGMEVVPQILTKKAEDFIDTAKELYKFGYQEINFNLGCPSGTVVSKGRGSGFLAKTEELNLFFEKIFSDSVFREKQIHISVKTRIGKEDPEEFYKLIEIFNQYPIFELTIHPRTQKDYYKGEPNWKVFADAVKLSKNPLCYNGNLYTISDYQKFIETFPQVNAVMLGRGLISNPALLQCIKGKNMPEKQQFLEFHNKLYNDYKQVLSGDMPVLFKMKEIWLYMITVFIDSEKYLKKIKKVKHCKDYEIVIDELFRKSEIISEAAKLS